MKKPKFIKRRFLLRLFALPFVVGLNLVFLVYILLVQSLRFLLYGGEFITHNKVTDYDTISDVMKFLNELKKDFDENKNK